MWRIIVPIAVVMSGCNFGAKTCVTSADCVSPATCQMGFCTYASDAAVTGGGVGGGSGGGSGGGGGITGGGGGVSGGGGVTGGGAGGGAAYCDAGLSCAPYEECVASASGGACAPSDIALSWVSPNNNGLTRGPANPSFNAVVFVDAGSMPMVVPVFQEDGGFMADLMFAGNGSYSGNVTLAGPDGAKVLIAGWVASSASGHTARQTVTWDETAPMVAVSFDAGAAQRDDLRRLGLSSTEPLGSATVTLGGVVMGPDDAGCGANAGCWVVDFSLPPLDSMSGSFTLVVTALDAVGNTRIVDAGTVAVSRRRWEVQPTVQAIRAAPAIGFDGTIYVAAAADVTSSLYALDPSDGGTLRSTPLGIAHSLALARNNGTEHVYFSAEDGTGGKVGALVASTFAAPVQPAVRGNGAGPTYAAIALVGKPSLEVGAVGVFNAMGGSSRVAVYSPVNGAEAVNAVDGGGTFNFAPVSSVGSATNIIVNSSTTEAWLLTSPPMPGGLYWNSVGNILATPTQGVQRQLEVPGNDCCLDGQAFVNSASLVTGQTASARKVYAVNASSQTTGDLGMPVNNAVPAVADGSTAFMGRGSLLVRFNPSMLSTAATTLSSGVNVRTSPVLGKAGPRQTVGMGYALTDSGGVLAFALDANSAVAWGNAFASSVSVYAHSTLDCNRRPGAATTTTGILYVATSSGRVAAIIVDSPKLLDTAGAWPKFQRTAANAGNTDNTRFPFNPGCP